MQEKLQIIHLTQGGISTILLLWSLFALFFLIFKVFHYFGMEEMAHSLLGRHVTRMFRILTPLVRGFGHV